MNRSLYFNYIEEHLMVLVQRISVRSSINLLDLNIHSESFFADLMNCIFGYEFKNLNQIKQNVDGIDLIDHKNKIFAQVSSTCTTTKINGSLAKRTLNDYTGYKFIFIALKVDASKLKNKTYSVPSFISFDPTQDIYDVKTLLRQILNDTITNQHNLYKLIKDELSYDMDSIKMDSNLATIINIISKENFNYVSDSPEINTFEIQNKINFNGLVSIKPIIDDYKIFYKKIDEKYTEFDRLGNNKSISVFNAIRSKYLSYKDKIESPTDLFFLIIDEIVELVKKSRNFEDIPFEELNQCVSILVVDAFIRCKIFENPEGYNHVITR